METENAPEYLTVRYDRGGHIFVVDLEITQFPLIAYSPEWTEWGEDEPHDRRVRRKLVGFRLRKGYDKLLHPPVLLNFGTYGAIVFDPLRS